MTPSEGDQVRSKPSVSADMNTRSWTFGAIKAPTLSKHMLRPRQQTRADKFSYQKLVRLPHNTEHHFPRWGTEYNARMAAPISKRDHTEEANVMLPKVVIHEALANEVYLILNNFIFAAFTQPIPIYLCKFT